MKPVPAANRQDVAAPCPGAARGRRPLNGHHSLKQPIGSTAMRKALLLGLTLITLHAPGRAQEIRWYQIEVLFFRNLANAAQFEEQWPTTVGLKIPASSYEMPGRDGAGAGRLEPYQGVSLQTAASGGSGAPPALDYAAAAAGSGALTSARARLNSSSNYRVIDYRSWRQALKSDARPLYLHVTAGNRVGDTAELEGYLGLSLKRYLHLDADLWWVDLGDAPAAADDAGAGTQRVAHLQENRRMRSAETHYLDHPLIGMLIHISPASGPGG